jgi:hypothetical protein
MSVEVLALQREVLGERHPDTTRSMASLAATYHEQGRYSEAEKIQNSALILRREALGATHPDTLWSMEYLAYAWHALGRQKEAVEMMEECCQKRRVILGADHPHTRRSERELRAWQGTQSEQGTT